MFSASVPNQDSNRSAFLAAFFCLEILIFSLLLSANAHAGPITYLDESFRGTTAEGWQFITGEGEGSSLTAATGDDADGEGWLRLTQDLGWQSSFAYYDTALNTSEGLVFTFDFMTWSGNSSGWSLGDGFALALFDAEATPQAGAYGGSLGYAQRDGGTPGLAGGLLGIGFDEFGNFSNPNEGRVGGTERTRNSIAIRGSEENDYAYLAGTDSLDNFATHNVDTRPDETAARTVRITIPTDMSITVEWMQGEGDWETLIETHANVTFPDEIKFGYTAGTGRATAFHEIRNLSVSSATSVVPQIGVRSLSSNVFSVPEPTTLVLLLLGGLGFMAHRRWHNGVHRIAP